MVNKKNKKIKKFYMILIIFIVILFAISFISNKKSSNKEYQEELTKEEIKNTENENIIALLQNMEERDRMEYYFGMFLEYIESEKYQDAYDLLYSEFKENYFPTLESFEKYAEETFPEMSNVEHDNIERNGDVYVLWIYITDAINGKPGEKQEMNVVIKENDYNDFVLSFSVI